MIDLFFQAPPADWDAFALKHGLVVAARNDEGNAVAVPSPGVHIDVISALPRVRAKLDRDGNVIEPAVVGEAQHVNLRLTDDDLGTRIKGLFRSAIKERVAVDARVRAEYADAPASFDWPLVEGVRLIAPAPRVRKRVWFGEQ